MVKRILLIGLIAAVGMLDGLSALSAEDALQPQIDAIKAIGGSVQPCLWVKEVYG